MSEWLPFYVMTSFFCRDTLSVVSYFDPWSQLLFQVATQNCWCAFFSCRDMGIRSRPSSFFNHCNSCRDLKIMSQAFFLPFQSQPYFLLTIVSHQFIFFFWSRLSSGPSYFVFFAVAQNLVATCFNCSIHFYVAT